MAFAVGAAAGIIIASTEVKKAEEPLPQQVEKPAPYSRTWELNILLWSNGYPEARVDVIETPVNCVFIVRASVERSNAIAVVPRSPKGC